MNSTKLKNEFNNVKKKKCHTYPLVITLLTRTSFKERMVRDGGFANTSLV